MTGFGTASVSRPAFSAAVVVRCVNGKRLKTKVSGLAMPGVEDRIARLVAKRIRRGTVEVSVRLDWADAGGGALNERVVGGYVKRLEQLREKLGLEEPVCLDRVALLPGAVQADGPGAVAWNSVWRKLRPVVAEALDKAVQMKESEGETLSRTLRRVTRRMSRLVEQLERAAPRAVERYRKRLHKRVSDLLDKAGAEADAGSLAREVILYSERSDISEELCRLKAHIENFNKALEGTTAGRKLEFIAQEMHREANTIASKTPDPKMVRWTIDLRGHVDEIREQVMNLE
jgi:uncharacterized protein (TIGR00255 family)